MPPRLLGRAETQALVEQVIKLTSSLIDDVLPKMVGIATLKRVLQQRLRPGRGRVGSESIRTVFR